MVFVRKGYWIKDFYSMDSQSEMSFFINIDTLPTDFISHTHDYLELTVILKGTARHVMAGNEYFLKAGDVHLVNIGVSHAYKDVHSLMVANIGFKSELYDLFGNDVKKSKGFLNLFGQPSVPGEDTIVTNITRLSLEQLNQVELILREMDNEYRDKSPHYQTMLKGNFIRLVTFLSRLLRGDENRPELPDTLGLSQAVDYIEKNYLKEIPLTTVAPLSGMTVKHFSRVFKQHYFINPMEYIIQLRLEHAKKLLKNPDLPITEIAFNSGFRDSNFFSREFKKKTKLSPSQYRKKHI